MSIKNLCCHKRPKDDQNCIGVVFSCKFSKNLNNTHIMGCSTYYGEIILQNTKSHNYCPYLGYKTIPVHGTRSPILNFSWAEPHMKLVTACRDGTSKLCSLLPWGTLQQERVYNCNSSVTSVMFYPGSSDVFCGGCQDGSIKIWDCRINNNKPVIELNHEVHDASYKFVLRSTTPNEERKESAAATGIMFRKHSIISCSTINPYLKLWDMRRICFEGKHSPLSKLNCDQIHNFGFGDIIENPESTLLYASGLNNVIYCFALDTTDTEPKCQYSGHELVTKYSKISISNNGRYLFTGCKKNGGFLWSTKSKKPQYVNKPMLKMAECFSTVDINSSDWCIDPKCLKVGVSTSEGLPLLFTIPTIKESNEQQIVFTEISEMTSNKLFEKNCVGRKNLVSKLQISTEKNMRNGDSSQEL